MEVLARRDGRKPKSFIKPRWMKIREITIFISGVAGSAEEGVSIACAIPMRCSEMAEAGGLVEPQRKSLGWAEAMAIVFYYWFFLALLFLALVRLLLHVVWKVCTYWLSFKSRLVVFSLGLTFYLPV